MIANKFPRPVLVLGIETSCDETAAAIVRDDRLVLAHVLLSQMAAHQPYGGVVPEIAARAHLDHLDGLIARAMRETGLDFADLDGIAATAGPGLIGGVLVGVMAAKAIALVRGKPFLAINHLEAHALTVRLCEAVAFPYLLLLVSGGHAQLLVVEGVGQYRRLGTTLDDAVGEAFDKTAKMLGLGYPGGPAVERAAMGGDGRRFDLPRPLRGRLGADFSFSGLKTAVGRQINLLPPGPLADRDVRDMAASFQVAIADCLVDRCRNALRLFRRGWPAGKVLVVAGGVAANAMLRQALATLAAEEDMLMIAPPPALCTDNGVMVAWAGIERLRLGLTDGLDLAPRPRWPLDPAPATLAG
jgi:N6-L-threonylcarbamoyladenine synthase